MQRSCQNGWKCYHLLAGNCNYDHNNDQKDWVLRQKQNCSNDSPCKKKGDCPYLANGLCKYLHTKSDCTLIKIKKDNDECQLKERCGMNLLNLCMNHHTEKENLWAKAEREKPEKKSPPVLCKDDRNCWELKSKGKCQSLHLKSDYEQNSVNDIIAPFNALKIEDCSICSKKPWLKRILHENH